jgi:hypothetical protein
MHPPFSNHLTCRAIATRRLSNDHPDGAWKAVGAELNQVEVVGSVL